MRVLPQVAASSYINWKYCRLISSMGLLVYVCAGQLVFDHLIFLPLHKGANRTTLGALRENCGAHGLGGKSGAE